MPTTLSPNGSGPPSSKPEISYEVDGTAGKAFFRLKYTDQTAEPGKTLEESDFDNDGLSNIDEIDPPAPATLMSGGTVPPPSAGATDPTVGDTDGDGMGDGFERDNGFDPNDSDENSNGIPDGQDDEDNDGTTNANEQGGGTDPGNAADFPPALWGVVNSINATGNFFNGSDSCNLEFTTWDGSAKADQALTVKLEPAVIQGALRDMVFPDHLADAITQAPARVEGPGTVHFCSASFLARVTGPYFHRTGNHRARRCWVRAPAAAVPQEFRYVELTTHNPGATSFEDILEVRKITLTIPADQTDSGFHDLYATTTYTPGVDHSTTVSLLPVKIVPASGMSGITGDTVPGINPASLEKHYVSPRLTPEIPAPHVILQATGIDAARITPGDVRQILEWSGGEAVPGEPLQRRVPRAAAGKTPVTIKTLQQYGGEEVQKMNVWVTWADLELQENTPKIQPPSDNGTEHTLKAKISYRYTCSPETMFDISQDVPNFNLAPNPPAPGGNHPWPAHTPLAGGAAIRYDATRQVRAALKSSDSVVLEFEREEGISDINYPTDISIGNDDPDMGGEFMPYEGAEGVQGIMRDVDSPHYTLKHDRGLPDATFLMQAQFRQYARIQIAGKWYQCSALELSDLKFKFKKANGKWADDGSTFVTGNGPFPPQ